MLSRLLKLKVPLALAFGFLCLHAASLLAFRENTALASYPWMSVAPLLAMTVCFRRAQITTSRARLTWGLLSVGLFLWTTGMLLLAWEEMRQQVSVNVAFLSDFAFFLYGIPVLLAISSPAVEQRIRFFVFLDGLQALLAAYLTYITLFSVSPFSSEPMQPISGSLMVVVYNVENVVLACAATLRLLAQPDRGEEKRASQIACGFLWVYAVLAGTYNYLNIETSGHTVSDLLVDIPFLLLAVAALQPVIPPRAVERIPSKKPMALFLDNVSPIFYTAALLALGISVVRAHYDIGIAAILVSTSVYGIHTAVLQGRYIQSQHALELARDRLEAMSLRDGLTNVANRRCFDLVFEQEWNRAMRMQHSLSLLLIDIDYFKNINDRCGHRFGDRCLIEIAAVLQSVLPRSGDLLARYGGEEFAVVLPATDQNGARAVAERMQKAVIALQIGNETEIGQFVTVSIGIAVQELPNFGSPAELLESSDQALYKAKQNGRDRIEVFPVSTAPLPSPAI